VVCQHLPRYKNEEKILLGQLLPKIQTKIKALPCKKWPGATEEIKLTLGFCCIHGA
jgi:hypothetical protein